MAVPPLILSLAVFDLVANTALKQEPKTSGTVNSGVKKTTKHKTDGQGAISCSLVSSQVVLRQRLEANLHPDRRNGLQVQSVSLGRLLTGGGAAAPEDIC